MKKVVKYVVIIILCYATAFNPTELIGENIKKVEPKECRGGKIHYTHSKKNPGKPTNPKDKEKKDKLKCPDGKIKVIASWKHEGPGDPSSGQIKLMCKRSLEVGATEPKDGFDKSSCELVGSKITSDKVVQCHFCCSKPQPKKDENSQSKTFEVLLDLL